MKAQIRITGQIGSINCIFNKINCYDFKKGMFGAKICLFDSVKEAREAIRKAYISLKSEYPIDPMLAKSKDNTFLDYDAATATLEKL